MSMTGNTAGLTVPQTGFATMLRDGFRAHSLLFVLVAAYYLCDLYFLGSEPVGFLITMAASIALGLVMIIFSTFMARFVILAGSERPDKPIKALAKDMWRLMITETGSFVGAIVYSLDSLI